MNELTTVNQYIELIPHGNSIIQTTAQDIIKAETPREKAALLNGLANYIRGGVAFMREVRNIQKDQRQEESKVVSIKASHKKDGDDNEYWKNILNVKRFIVQWNKTEYPNNESNNVMPTARQLETNLANKLLVRAIDDYHGGFKRVAEILGLKF